MINVKTAKTETKEEKYNILKRNKVHRVILLVMALVILLFQKERKMDNTNRKSNNNDNR